jgi:hypothetical protein
MNLEIKKQNRIELSELIGLLKGDESDLQQTLILTPGASNHWVTDADLYKASLVLENEPTHHMLAKVLETITIIPARAAGEEKKPLTSEELEQLRKVNRQ